MKQGKKPLPAQYVRPVPLAFMGALALWGIVQQWQSPEAFTLSTLAYVLGVSYLRVRGQRAEARRWALVLVQRLRERQGADGAVLAAQAVAAAAAARVVGLRLGAR